jgi:hypothetical protein
MEIQRLCFGLLIQSFFACTVVAQISSDQFQYHCGKKLRVAINAQEPYIIVDPAKVTCSSLVHRLDLCRMTQVYSKVLTLYDFHAVYAPKLSCYGLSKVILPNESFYYFSNPPNIFLQQWRRNIVPVRHERPSA